MKYYSLEYVIYADKALTGPRPGSVNEIKPPQLRKLETNPE